MNTTSTEKIATDSAKTIQDKSELWKKDSINRLLQLKKAILSFPRKRNFPKLIQISPKYSWDDSRNSEVLEFFWNLRQDKRHLSKFCELVNKWFEANLNYLNRQLAQGYFPSVGFNWNSKELQLPPLEFKLKGFGRPESKERIKLGRIISEICDQNFSSDEVCKFFHKKRAPSPRKVMKNLPHEINTWPDALRVYSKRTQNYISSLRREYC